MWQIPHDFTWFPGTLQNLRKTDISCNRQDRGACHISDNATWGHHKVCIKPGDFAESLAVIVLDRKRERCRAVIVGRTSPPAYLDGVARLVESASGWSSSLHDEIMEATGADFRAASFGDETDRYASNLHRTAIVRAAKEALSS